MNTSIKYNKKHTPGRSFKVIKKHHELVYKEFQEEIKQEQGKCYLSEQLWEEREGTISQKKKAFLEKDAHSK